MIDSPVMSALEVQGDSVRAASRVVAQLSREQKDAVLLRAADELSVRSDYLLDANAADVAAAREAGTAETVIDRLRLDEARLASMTDGLRQVASLDDPIGETLEAWTRPNGLEITKVRVPLGVVGIIYENRPNVTSDAAALCLKSGNAAFLRGSAAAIHSNRAIVQVLRSACEAEGVPSDAVSLVDDTSRESAMAFMQLRGRIDCLIPRGGPGLIAAILENATVPFIIDGAGNCHIYVDAAADLDMAAAIVNNAKTQRPSVCNAAESLVVHQTVASQLLPRLVAAMPMVSFVGDDAAQRIVDIDAATDDDFAREFLDLRMSIRVVDDLAQAIEHINRFSTGHTEAIVTADDEAASRFAREVDAAAIAVNASTRFTDGEQFGFGGEIGISTQKLHARGPMGLRELTTTKYIVQGTGQVRT